MLSEKWYGTWRGTLTLAPPPKNFPSNNPMQLRIAALGAGRWSWVIAYAGQPERNYELRSLGEGLVLDERNGILLDAVLEGDELLSVFEVGGRLLLTRYTLSKATLVYETQTFTKGELGPNQVASWKRTSVQRASLKRVAG